MSVLRAVWILSVGGLKMFRAFEVMNHKMHALIPVCIKFRHRHNIMTMYLHCLWFPWVFSMIKLSDIRYYSWQLLLRSCSDKFIISLLHKQMLTQLQSVTATRVDRVVSASHLKSAAKPEHNSTFTYWGQSERHRKFNNKYPFNLFFQPGF